jgi:hypothetical protein
VFVGNSPIIVFSTFLTSQDYYLLGYDIMQIFTDILQEYITATFRLVIPEDGYKKSKGSPVTGHGGP